MPHSLWHAARCPMLRRLVLLGSGLFILSSSFGFQITPSSTYLVPNDGFHMRRRPFATYQSSLPVDDSYGDEDDDDDEEEDLDGLVMGTTTGTEIDDFARDDKFQQRANRWILLVDDEESIRKSVGQLLFDRGFQVTACADAPTALQIAQERRDDYGNPRLPDVIVSDVRMPQMGGLEFVQRLRQDGRLQAIPVVLLTAKGLVQDRIAGYDAGADVYLPKPFDPEELLSICDGLITQYEIVNGADIDVEDLQQDLNEIKYMLLEKGGGGVGNGWVDEESNVFLAPDERQVLELLCQGLMNKEIAAQTFLSKRRVEQLLTGMYRKVNVKNRTELVRWAVSSGNVQI